MTLVLVCGCGARVRAPGAQPGRTGRCPACGARLRVPDVLPKAPPGAEVEVHARIEPRRREPAPAPVHAEDEATRAGGYGVLPERAPVGSGGPRSTSTGGSSRRQATREAGTFRRRSPGGASGPEPGGLVRRPEGVESTLTRSLLYPLWDGPALALLAFLAPVCAVASVFSFGLRGFVLSGDEVQTLGALTMVLPMLSALAMLFGYAGLFLADVLESSARGEVRHPRLPPWEFFEMLGGLVRWLGACGFGIAAGAVLTAAYHGSAAVVEGGTLRVIDEVVMAALLGSGAAFWPVALAAVVLHADLRAANPWTVLQAMRRAGPGSIGISLLFGLAGAGTLALADGLYLLPRLGLGATVLGIALFWVLFWYEAIVLMRRLGLFYRRHARALGWFSEGPGRGA